MQRNPNSEYEYHIQNRHKVFLAANGADKTTSVDQHPHEVHRRQLKRFAFGLTFMLVFLITSYLVAVLSWKFGIYRVAKQLPKEEEPENPARAPVLPRRSIGLTATGNSEAVQRAEALVREGDISLQNENLRGAISAYTEAIQACPDYAPAYPRLGRAYLQAGMFRRARYVLEKAVHLYPSEPDLLNDLGIAYCRLERYEDAVNAWDSALELNPSYLAALFNKAVCRKLLGDLTGAEALLDRYLQSAPDDPFALKEKAFLHAARGKYEAALELLKQAIDKTNWPSFYFESAATAALLSREDEALRYLERAVQLTSPAVVYIAFQQPAFDKMRSSEAGQRFQRELVRLARAEGPSKAVRYRPGTIELLPSFSPNPIL